MNIAQIVLSAVTQLIPYLAKAGEEVAKKAGDASWERLKALYQDIHNRFSLDKDDYAQQTLKRLEEKPSEESRQRALSDILTEKAEADPKFAEELRQLTQNNTQGKKVSQFVTPIYGGEVGKIVNIAQARDVSC